MNKLYRILVVETSVPAQKIAKMYLTELECLVDIAANGNEAIEKCNIFHYHVVLMDLCLYPGTNGLEIAKLIKNESRLNKDTPIVILSIHSEAQFYKELKEAHITEFISKPFTRFEAVGLVNFIRDLKSHSTSENCTVKLAKNDSRSIMWKISGH